MTDRVNGGVFGGEFLTGKMDFFSFSTSLLMDQTKVNTPAKDLYQPSSIVWSPVTIVDAYGVAQTYASKADYIEAWKKQQNLDKIVNLFSSRANPVIVSVNSRGELNMATEKTGLWYVDDGVGNYGDPALDTNETGYKLEDALVTIKLWAPGDNVDTGAPSDVISFGLAGNSTVARRTFL